MLFLNRGCSRNFPSAISRMSHTRVCWFRRRPIFQHEDQPVTSTAPLDLSAHHQRKRARVDSGFDAVRDAVQFGDVVQGGEGLSLGPPTGEANWLGVTNDADVSAKEAENAEDHENRAYVDKNKTHSESADESFKKESLANLLGSLVLFIKGNFFLQYALKRYWLSSLTGTFARR